jgi:hypothetical protein
LPPVRVKTKKKSLLFMERATPDGFVGILSPTGILDYKTGGN